MPIGVSMTFADIKSEVQGLRFSSSQSASIGHWVNDRYAALWHAEEWTFRYAQANVSVTAGSNVVTASLSGGLGTVIGLWRADGFPLRWMPPKAYFNLYAGATDTGAPEFYTVINGTIYIGPTSNETSSAYTLLYERAFVALVNDSDSPLIPAENHYLLVVGSLALGLALMNDFTWEFMEQRWQQGIQEMRAKWLVDQRGDVTQWGRDEVEALPTFWGV